MADTVPSATEVQSAIERVRGIISCRVIDRNGEIAEIHILADTSRTAKQVVRDVESLCAAQFGLEIDHRKISVALINQPLRPRPVPRPEMRGVRVETEGRRVTVHVAIGTGDTVVEGKADNAGTSINRMRVAANAALDAYEKYVGGSCKFVLEDLVPFHLGGWNGFLAGVAMITSLGEERLVGSALVKGDEIEAAVKSACNAVNRRIGKIDLEDQD